MFDFDGAQREMNVGGILKRRVDVKIVNLQMNELQCCVSTPESINSNRCVFDDKRLSERINRIIWNLRGDKCGSDRVVSSRSLDRR